MLHEDGEQFLTIKGAGLETEMDDAEIVVVENWFEEFRDRQDR